MTGNFTIINDPRGLISRQNIGEDVYQEADAAVVFKNYKGVKETDQFMESLRRRAINYKGNIITVQSVLSESYKQ
jgi:hypothetical protein